MNRYSLNAVVPIRPLEEPGRQEAMRTWLYHELAPNEGFEIRVRGEDTMQRTRDLDRLLEYLGLVRKWAEEDGVFLAAERKRIAETWWEREMEVWRESNAAEAVATPHPETAV